MPTRRSADQRKRCEKCRAEIPPQQGSSRPRKFCTTCSPPRNRANPRVIDLAAPAPSEGEPVEPALVASYRKRLSDAERLGTPEGETVLHLALLLATGAHTASGAASLSRELRAAMEEALRGAPQEADAVDELAERRARKVGGA